VTRGGFSLVVAALAASACGGASTPADRPFDITLGPDGYLNLDSVPPSTCFLDGEPIGSTPRLHVGVKPGRHTLRFVNEEQGLTRTFTVDVRAGDSLDVKAQ
jgi:hypothetical protein